MLKQLDALDRSEQVINFLKEVNAKYEFKRFEGSTKTSELAAEVLGCSVAQIAKSIVFKSDFPVVVVLSGDKRVSKEKLSMITGKEVEIAERQYVIEKTGYDVGGVPPFPHRKEVLVLLDSSLERFEYVWAAGGSSNSVFKIAVRELRRILGKEMVEVSD